MSDRADGEVKVPEPMEEVQKPTQNRPDTILSKKHLFEVHALNPCQPMKRPQRSTAKHKLRKRQIRRLCCSWPSSWLCGLPPCTLRLNRKLLKRGVGDPKVFGGLSTKRARSRPLITESLRNVVACFRVTLVDVGPLLGNAAKNARRDREEESWEGLVAEAMQSESCTLVLGEEPSMGLFANGSFSRFGTSE